MIRNIVGSVVALLGAAAAVQSPFHSWYDGRLGRDFRIQDLFNGISGASSAVMSSILLPFLFAALLTLVGVVLRSRWLVALAGLVVLGFTVLWMVRQGQAAGSLTVAGDGSGLGWGVASAAGGGLLLLLGALLMSGRRRKPGRHTDTDTYLAPGREHPDTWPPTQEPGPSAHTSPGPEPEAEPYTGPGPRYDDPRYDEARHDEARHDDPRYDEARHDRDTAQYPVQDENPDDRRRYR